MEVSKQIAIFSTGPLSPTDPQLLAVAKRLHQKPEHLVAKIQALIPNPAEQQIYLTLADEFGMRPRRFVHIIRRTMNHREIRFSDFLEKETAPHITYSYGDVIIKEIRLALRISSPQAQEDYGYSLTSATAAEIVGIYGEEAESFFTSLSEYVTEEVGDGESKKFRTVLAEMTCRRILEAYHDNKEFVALLTSDVSDVLEYVEQVHSCTLPHWNLNDFDRGDEED